MTENEWEYEWMLEQVMVMLSKVACHPWRDDNDHNCTVNTIWDLKSEVDKLLQWVDKRVDIPTKRPYELRAIFADDDSQVPNDDFLSHSSR